MPAPLFFAFWLQRIKPYFAGFQSRWFGASLLSLFIGSSSKGTSLGYQFYLLFIPLYGLLASRYRRDDAVTVAPTERDFSSERFLGITLMVIQLSSERD
ncbi:MAG: hypothetical protein V7K21_00300 [Nostoc sp.]|uniref:hypothetical protein n=1 Tax=Nostoc sp. TaxID=1180 RepID=UPI002FF61D6F